MGRSELLLTLARDGALEGRGRAARRCGTPWVDFRGAGRRREVMRWRRAREGLGYSLVALGLRLAVSARAGQAPGGPSRPEW